MAVRKAKKTSRFKNPPTGVAVSVGRALGRLMARRDKLMQQLSGVDEKIAEARAREAADVDSPVPPRVRSRAVAGGRAVTESSRRTMETAARKRWPAVKRPNSKGTGR